MPMPPFDIFLSILDFVEKPDLAKLCLVNKTVRDITLDTLYRNISVINILNVCVTLYQCPDLALRVKSFTITSRSTHTFLPGRSPHYTLLARALGCLLNLQNLKLIIKGSYSWILPHVAEPKLQTFFCALDCDRELVYFVKNQPELITVKFWSAPYPGHPIPGAEFLPKLLHLEAPLAWLSKLVPGRPVEHVKRLQYRDSGGDIAFLASSSAPIRALTMNWSSLRQLSLPQLSSMLYALERIVITVSLRLMNLTDEVYL